MSDKKKASKDVGVVTALRAFEATYKAACRAHDTLPYKPLLITLQQAQEESKRCDKIHLSGLTVDGAVASAIIECLASYAAVTSLCCHGCSIGDEGLTAISHLLRASANKWWRGCKLAILEVCADGRVLPLQQTPAAAALTAAVRTRSTAATDPYAEDTAAGNASSHGAATNTATAAGGAASQPAIQHSAQAAGSSNNKPGLQQKVLSGNRPGSAAEASSRSATFMPGASAGMSQQQSNTFQRPSTTFHSGHQSSRGLPVKQLPPGVCPPVPAHLQINSITHMQLAQQPLRERCGPVDLIRYKAQPPRPMVEVGRWVLDATLDDWKQHQQEMFSSSMPYSPQSSVGSPVASAAAQQLQWRQDYLLPKQQQQLQHQSSEQQQGAAALRMEAEQCPRFGPTAVQQLSLALGVAELPLTRLLLDHTLIGDAGISTLSAGLAKCHSLKYLSICYCGIGTAGIRDLAAACAPTSAATAAGAGAVAAAAVVSRLSTVTGVAADSSSPGNSGGLWLDVLLLNGNPLGAAGLQQLNPALRVMPSLKVLGLADIGVTDADKVQLKGLVYALTIGPTELEQLDFDVNYIGDRAATHFLTLLPAKPSLIMLKLTARVSPEVVTQLTSLLEQNLKLAKPKGKKKTAKKK